MIRLSMQFFAHKKGVGSTKTVVILSPNGWVSNVPMVSMYWPATFWFASAAHIHPGERWPWF